MCSVFEFRDHAAITTDMRLRWGCFDARAERPYIVNVLFFCGGIVAIVAIATIAVIATIAIIATIGAIEAIAVIATIGLFFVNTHSHWVLFLTVYLFAGCLRVAVG